MVPKPKALGCVCVTLPGQPRIVQRAMLETCLVWTGLGSWKGYYLAYRFMPSMINVTRTTSEGRSIRELRVKTGQWAGVRQPIRIGKCRWVDWITTMARFGGTLRKLASKLFIVFIC